MYTIIQEKLKRINSRLSPIIMASILGSLLIIMAFFIGRESVYFEKINNNKQDININFSSLNKDNILNSTNIESNNSQIEIKQGVVTNTVGDTSQSIGRIYASSKGKKYYIEGICDGNISLKNKVYYKDENSAIKSGKTKASGC